MTVKITEISALKDLAKARKNLDNLEKKVLDCCDELQNSMILFEKVSELNPEKMLFSLALALNTITTQKKSV